MQQSRWLNFFVTVVVLGSCASQLQDRLILSAGASRPFPLELETSARPIDAAVDGDVVGAAFSRTSPNDTHLVIAHKGGLGSVTTSTDLVFSSSPTCCPSTLTTVVAVGGAKFAVLLFARNGSEPKVVFFWEVSGRVVTGGTDLPVGFEPSSIAMGGGGSVLVGGSLAGKGELVEAFDNGISAFIGVEVPLLPVEVALRGSDGCWLIRSSGWSKICGKVSVNFVPSTGDVALFQSLHAQGWIPENVSVMDRKDVVSFRGSSTGYVFRDTDRERYGRLSSQRIDFSIGAVGPVVPGYSVFGEFGTGEKVVIRQQDSVPSKFELLR
jgi:hypothetical protein